jgi:hypothetical protein
MGYQLTGEQKAGYLHIRVSGENSPETVRRYLEEVFLSCLRRQCSIVLIEEDLRGPGLGVLEIHQIVTEGSKRTWPTVRRIAYVDTNKEHSQSDMHFAETVAVNLGVNIKLFPTVNEAEAWLRDAAVPSDT